MSTKYIIFVFNIHLFQRAAIAESVLEAIMHTDNHHMPIDCDCDICASQRVQGQIIGQAIGAAHNQTEQMRGEHVQVSEPLFVGTLEVRGFHQWTFN